MGDEGLRPPTSPCEAGPVARQHCLALRGFKIANCPAPWQPLPMLRIVTKSETVTPLQQSAERQQLAGVPHVHGQVRSTRTPVTPEN